MATKSILKDVTIKERNLAHTFIKALENAENVKNEPQKASKKCTDLTTDKVKEFFGK